MATEREGKVRAFADALAAEDGALRGIREASDAHRETHGKACTVYPSSPAKGRFLFTLMCATRPRRVLEVGCGLGYSAAWMAKALDHGGVVDTVEGDDSHARLARANLARAGAADRVRVLVGPAEEIVPSLSGPYDLVFEDAAFGAPPRYLEDMIRVLRVGGLLVTSNWFPIEFAITGEKSPFGARAGPGLTRYADRVFRNPRLTGILVPWAWWGVSAKVRE